MSAGAPRSRQIERDDAVDEARVPAQEPGRVGAIEKRRAQRGAAGAQFLLPALRAVLRRARRGSFAMASCHGEKSPRGACVTRRRRRRARPTA